MNRVTWSFLLLASLAGCSTDDDAKDAATAAAAREAVDSLRPSVNQQRVKLDDATKRIRELENIVTQLQVRLEGVESSQREIQKAAQKQKVTFDQVVTHELIVGRPNSGTATIRIDENNQPRMMLLSADGAASVSISANAGGYVTATNGESFAMIAAEKGVPAIRLTKDKTNRFGVGVVPPNRPTMYFVLENGEQVWLPDER